MRVNLDNTYESYALSINGLNFADLPDAPEEEEIILSRQNEFGDFSKSIK